MIGDLRKQYRVTTIDLLGMGCSGRPSFNCKGTQESIDFFMKYLKIWFEKTKYNE
jgi:hypothetical protein